MLKTILICVGLLVCAEALSNKVVFAALQTNATFNGTAQTCFMGRPVPVGNVSVSAFKVSNARPLVAHLDSMAKFGGFGIGDDTTASSQFDAMETQLHTMINGTAALARRTSASDGKFSIFISAVDSLLVVGYANMEDEPYVYAYKIMPGLSDTSFILDMSGGDCGF
jgi:hypothetical protein